jgi:hypothetical protein
MHDSIVAIRNGIESDYITFKRMDSDGPYRFAGYGETGHMRFPLADNGFTRISYESNFFKNAIRDGCFFGNDDENLALDYGGLEVDGDFVQTSVFDRGIFLFPRDGFLKAVAGCYSHKAKFGEREKEFWINMLLNYLKRGSFESEGRGQTDEKFADAAKQTYDKGVKNAAESAETLKRVMDSTDGRKYVVSLSSIDPFRTATPNQIEIEGKFDFSAGSGHGIRKSDAKGRLVLNPHVSKWYSLWRNPERYSLHKVPCTVSSGYFETPNISNDIARTDGIRQRKPMILKGSDAEVYIEDAGRAYNVPSLDDFFGSMTFLGQLEISAGIATAIFSGLVAAYVGLCDIFYDHDINFWESTLGLYKLGAPMLLTGLIWGAGGVISGIASGPFERKIIGNPSMKYLVRASQPPDTI